ncbi:MAG: thioredoxin domain-containing protein [Candidatus Eisenbacteria bacterium]
MARSRARSRGTANAASSSLRLTLRLVLAMAIAGTGLAAAVAAAEDASPPPESGAKAEIDWAPDFEQALERARFERSIVMVDFYTGWCGWCKVLDRETYVAPEVVERSKRMVCVKVDAEGRRDLAERYGVRAYPTIGFLNPDGSAIEMVRGYQPPTRFATTLDRFLDTSGREFTLRTRLKDHPELLEVRRDLALLLENKGEFSQAKAQMDTLFAGDPEKQFRDSIWDLRLDRARILLRAGDSKEARKEAERFVKKNKGKDRYAEGLYLLGEASLAVGDRKKARDSFRKLLEVRPEGWFASRSRERLADLG